MSAVELVLDVIGGISGSVIEMLLIVQIRSSDE
jgi:hypothetical protein